MDSALVVVGLLGGVLTVLFGALKLIARFGNRAIKDEHIEFVTKQRDTYRDAYETEQRECKRQIAEMGERIARLEGQVEALTGDLGDRVVASAAQVGERVGERIGTAILARLGERGIG